MLIDLSWASSQLEGNTYSRLDTRELIEHGRGAQGKDAIETQLILNHKAAIKLLVENLLPNPADEGRIRRHAVEIGLSVYRLLSLPTQIEDALDVLLDKADRIDDPFEQAFFVMAHLPYPQPLADINKRCSRLAANLPLFRANLCPLTFLDMPEQAYSRAMLEVYEMTRVKLLRDLFVWADERSTQEYLAIRQQLAEPDPLRLRWRDLIKSAVREVVTSPQADALELIERATAQAGVADAELADLHDGVLARYGLRPSQFETWNARRAAG